MIGRNAAFIKMCKQAPQAFSKEHRHDQQDKQPVRFCECLVAICSVSRSYEHKQNIKKESQAQVKLRYHFPTAWRIYSGMARSNHTTDRLAKSLRHQAHHLHHLLLL